MSYSCIAVVGLDYSGTHTFFFFFNDTATTEIYTLSLHDALPIFCWGSPVHHAGASTPLARITSRDRKSTRLNSSHSQISYAVFCLKKKHNTTHFPYFHVVSAPVPHNL